MRYVTDKVEILANVYGNIAYGSMDTFVTSYTAEILMLEIVTWN